MRLRNFLPPLILSVFLALPLSPAAAAAAAKAASTAKTASFLCTRQRGRSTPTAAVGGNHKRRYASRNYRGEGKICSTPPSSSLSRAHGTLATGTKLNSSAVPWVVLTLAGGNIGTPFVAKATKSWYTRIQRPSWLPPDGVFAPTWIVLYSTMGYSAFKVFERVGFASLPMRLALVHYALNVIWAPVFFGLKRLRLGHCINVSLVATLLIVIRLFHGVYPPSAYLLLPYLAWLVFATALSWSICALNPTVNGYNNAMLESDIFKLQRKAAEMAGL